MKRTTLLSSLAAMLALFGAARDLRARASVHASRSALGFLSDVAPVPAAVAPAAPRDWPTLGWDVGRSNVSQAPTGITAANVKSLRRQQVTIDGVVDASLIYLKGVKVNGAEHDVFFLTTSYGKTEAVDANDGSILWRYTPPGYDGWAGSYQFTNATPVADPNREFVYAASPDGKIQKLAVSDGHAVWSTTITLFAKREKIASPLSYFRGRVIAATGGYIGDAPPYQGHVAILDASSGKLLHVWNSLCSDRRQLIDPSSCSESGSAIWGRTGVVIDSVSGDLFIATGNGRWDGKTNWGDAMIVLDSSATSMRANYTPTNTDQLDSRDADVGSTSPALLGRSLVAQGGKDRKIMLLDLKQLGGATPHKGGETQSVATPSGDRLFTGLTVLRTGSTTWLFAADDGGTAAWTLSTQLVPAWKNGNGGTTPTIAGGLLYVYDPDGKLRVYQPESGELVAELECGSGHWNSPIIVDGKIALPEGNANRHATTGTLSIWRNP